MEKGNRIEWATPAVASPVQKAAPTAWVYHLRADHGGWLGQIVLTSDGMFSGVTDWGNLSFAWRAFGEGDFRDFILKLGPDYFSGKMAIGLSYGIGTSKKIDAHCDRFTMMILPPLKTAIRAQLKGEASAEPTPSHPPATSQEGT